MSAPWRFGPALGLVVACSSDVTAELAAPGPEQRACSGEACGVAPEVDPSVGFVAHYGPSDRDDPDEIAAFTIEPGKELVDCTYGALGNDAPLHYSRYSVYSGPAMHHVILYSMPSDVPDGYHDDCGERGLGASLLAVLQGGIEGSRYDYPPSGKVAPENEGLATRLEAHQMIAYEMHAVNPTDAPIVRENWTVFYAMPEDEVTGTIGQMAFNGGVGMAIPPRSRQTLTNTCVLDPMYGRVRILDFFGHMHAHGERFSAWVRRAGQSARTLVYESYDWSILDLIEFNSATDNTPVEYGSGTPGGLSGALELSPGDALEYECAMNNDGDTVLRFSARAFEGEMCNLFGSFTPGGYWTCVGQ